MRLNVKRLFRYLLSVLIISAIWLSTNSIKAEASVAPKIAAGHNHSLALKSDGTVWAWGYNLNGQLGDGTTTDKLTPVQTQGISSVQAIAAGNDFSLALKSDGTLWAWGSNTNGRLGDGTTTTRTTPVQVPGLSGVQAIAAGYNHSLALKSDGTVWAWGSNGSGQLGDGTTTNRYTPVQVSGLSGINAVSVGGAVAGSHSLALKSDGTVWAWGYNSSGQLGDGTATNRKTPVQVSGLSNVQAIAALGSHCLALKSDGTVLAWGNNYSGQIGDGTTTNRYTPVQVLSGIVAIAGGNGHSLAIKTDGNVWAWGWNGKGQIGDGTTTNRYTPVQVQGLNNVQAVSARQSHTLALKTDWIIWAWGWNSSGQLGDGTTTDKLAPVQVPLVLSVLSVSPSPLGLMLEQSQQLTVIDYSSGTGQDVTGSATYQSNDTGIATVSSTGLVTGVAQGTTNITVTYDGQTETVPVTTITTQSITVQPNSVSMLKNKVWQLTVTANLSNGTNQDVTSSATYQSSDTGIATVSSTGLVTGIAQGNANITVTYDGQTETVPVTITDGPQYIWVTNNGSNTVSRLTTDGTRTDFTVREGPYSVAVDQQGNAWVAYEDVGIDDTYITKLPYDGSARIDYDLGEETGSIAVDQKGNIWSTGGKYHGCGYLIKLSPEGTIVSYTLGMSISDIAVDKQGDIWMMHSSSQGRVIKMSANDGSFTEYATDLIPRAIAIDQQGNVWTANRGANYSLTREGTVSKLPSDGSPRIDYTACGGSEPQGIAIDQQGNVWINSTDVSHNGALSKFPFDGGQRVDYYGGGYGVAVDKQGNIWSTHRDFNKVAKLSPIDGTRTVYDVGTSPSAIATGMTFDIVFGTAETIQSTLQSITATPNPVDIVVDETQQLTVTAHYSDGTTQDVTSASTYQSDNTAVATVSGTGTITGVSVGSANITVIYDGQTVIVPVTVFDETEIELTGDFITLRTPQFLIPVTYDCAAGFTVTENGIDVPVTRVVVQAGTDDWPYSEIVLSLQYPVTVGSDVVIQYNADPNYPITPVDGGVTLIPTGELPAVNYSTVPFTMTSLTVPSSGDVVYINYPTAVTYVDYPNGAGYVIRHGNTVVPITRVVTSGTTGTIYLQHPVPAGEAVTVEYVYDSQYPITTVTGAHLSGTTQPVTVVNQSTSPVVITTSPVADGNTLIVMTPTGLIDTTYQGNAGFRVYADGQEIPVISVEVQGNNIILTLGAPIIPGQEVTFSYDPDPEQPITTPEGTPIELIPTGELPVDNESTAEIEYLSVYPDSATLNLGQEQQLTVTAHYSDGTTADVTELASYQSGLVSVATVTGGGLVTGVSPGSTFITVSYQGATVYSNITVNNPAPVLESITAAPDPVSLAKGLTQQLTVTAHMSDGTTHNVTAQASYQSDSTGVSTVSGAGLIAGVTQGSSNITVSYQGQTVVVPVTIVDPVIMSISATPNPVSLAMGNSWQLTVTAYYSDGATQDVTTLAAYESNNISIATVSAGGEVTGVSQGSTVVVVSYQGQTDSVSIVVAGPVVESITVNPNPVSLVAGRTQQLTVTAHMSDGTTQDVTDLTSCQSDTPVKVTVSVSGLVAGVTQGSANVTVTYQGQTVTVPVTVNAPVVDSITVTPNPVSLVAGRTQQLTVTAHMSDGTTQVVTGSAVYQ